MSDKPIRVTDFARKKARGEKIVMLTAYDATMAAILDRSGVDALLVGDSLGTVIMGHPTTLPVTMDVMVHHTSAVARGATRALVVADMPFLSFQASVADAVKNAGRLLQEGGAAAVKIEGGRAVADTVKRLVDVGIPVMGHLGLQPQSVHKAGGYVKAATRQSDADLLLEDAVRLEDAGVFAIVLESIPATLAQAVTQHTRVPTIGIAAGPDCDGQVLVSYDMLGLTAAVPGFVRQYAELARAIATAGEAYAADVRAGRYPARVTPEPSVASADKTR